MMKLLLLLLHPAHTWSSGSDCFLFVIVSFTESITHLFKSQAMHDTQKACCVQTDRELEACLQSSVCCSSDDVQLSRKLMLPTFKMTFPAGVSS